MFFFVDFLCGDLWGSVRRYKDILGCMGPNQTIWVALGSLGIYGDSRSPKHQAMKGAGLGAWQLEFRFGA